MYAQWRLRSAWTTSQSESSLSAWTNIGPLTTYWVHSEDSDQTGWMPRLIWVFTGRTSFCWFCRVAAHLDNEPLPSELSHRGQSSFTICHYPTPYTISPSNRLGGGLMAYCKTGLAPVSWVTRWDSNRHAQLKKLATAWEFWICQLRLLYYLGSEQQRCQSDCTKADLCLINRLFHNEAQIIYIKLERKPMKSQAYCTN